MLRKSGKSSVQEISNFLNQILIVPVLHLGKWGRLFIFLIASSQLLGGKQIEGKLDGYATI